MISCSAIQKLERYGLLGLKKKNTREYIQFSLNDEKRSNIYALTNLPTWEEALEAIARTHQQVSTGQQEGMAAATTSDSLLYAMSFSASLIAHHVHTVLLGTPSNIFDSQGDAGKDHIEFSLNMVKVLELIAVQLSASTANSTSASFVEGNFSVKALGHLLHSVLDVLMNSSVLLFAASSKLLKGKQDMKCFGEICTRAYIFTGAVIRLLHRTCSFSKTHSGNSTRELFSSKSCSSYLKQTQAKSTNASKQDAPSALVTEAIAEARPALSLLYTILSSCEKSDKSAIPFTFVSELVLLHKLALFHELCNAMPELLSQIPSGDSQSPASFAELQQSASMLLTSTCGSKATCYVLYYRGDDVKLLQNNINDMDEYSLYTYATSAPIEASLLQRVKDAFAANRFDEATLKCALAMLCWVCASPLIFRSFCYSDNWHVFAQEQRRKVLQYQANSRNALKSYNSKRSASEEKLTEKKEAGDGDNDTSSVHSHASSVGGAGSVNTNANSLSSYHTDMSSMISLSSRLSLLSSFSRHSTDTYLSFMSVLGPTQTNADWMATKYSHESEDGNTNLPLIFLEEIVLALQRFNEAISFTGGLFDSLYDCVVWKSVESLFLTVNHSSDRHEQNYSKEVRVPIFDFGNDVRYNNGRGFEILGLVFAKVIAPCLVEDGTVHKTSTIVESLSVCLSSYEFVAPHIIDQNLGIIVKLLCTSFRHAGDLLSLNESLVVNFFLNVISRLGKNNQLPLLLDVLLPKAVEESGEATSPLDENDERALVGVFSAGVVQSVYTTAVKYSFDQESLMKLFVDYVTANSVDSAVETLVHPTFVITLTVLTLRGMVPTSVSSTSILERATELELILCNAFTKLSAEFRKKEHRQGKEVEFSQLLCLTLWSIYECRRTTTECLQDLGLQNLKEYVQMLENMMWNTQTQLLQVVGDLSFDAVGQFAKAVGDSCVREAATTVILKLCIQRLVLAQNVFRLEGSADIAGQFKEDARTLSAFVLDQMRGESDADNATNDSRDALLFFVATVNENEWESLTVFSRSKSFREFCLFTIRQMFLQEVGNSHFLQWFNRILRAAPSYILRAITDVMLDIGSSTVLKFANGHEKDGDAAHIPSLLKALEICYLRVGHNPYWPTVLLCISKWCLPLKSQASAECKTALERLIRIVNLIVSSERNSHGVFRYVLSGEHGKPAGNSTLKPLYVEAIGVPRALLVEIGKDSSLWNEKTALGDWSFEDEIKTVTANLFSKQFLEVLAESAEGNDGLEAAASVLTAMHSICIESVKASPEGFEFLSQIQRLVLKKMEDQHVLELLSLFLAKLGDAPLLCKHSCSSEQCAQLEKNWKAIFHAILSSCLSSSNCDEKRLLQMKVFSQLMSYLSAHCSQSAAAKTEDAAHGEKQAKRPREDTERQPCNYAEFLFESPSAVVDAIVKSFSAHSEDGQKWLLLQAKGVATRFLFSLHAIVKSYATSHAGSRKQCKTVEEEIRTLFAGLSDRDQDTKKGEWFFDYNASLTVEYLEFLCSQVAGIPELLQSVAPLVPTEEEAFMTSYVNGLFQFILKMDLDKLRCESADRFLRAYALLSECAKVLDQLIHKPSLQNVPLTNFVHKLLVIASSSAVMKARTLSMREVGGPSLWGSLLSACNKVNIGKPRPSVPKRAKADSSHEKHKLLERDNLMDGIWLFVGALLHLEPTRPSQGEPLACLSCEEVLAVVQLFSQNLLYSDAFWRDSALLSFFVPRLFVVILKGRSTQLYDHRVVSRFLSLLFQLTRQAEAASHGEMKQVRLFSIAALCSSLFQTVSHYTSLFTSLNEELDGFSNDLLQIMRRSHLPFASAPSLKYNANRSAVAVERSSEFSLCDLAFVAVGEEEGKNLLRESAFLLQEQSNGPSTNRHSIFHVE